MGGHTVIIRLNSVQLQLQLQLPTGTELGENRCEMCNNSKEDGKKKGLTSLKDGKRIYVGELSRSKYERAKENENEKSKLSEESHQIKHWLGDHPDQQAPPRFKFGLIQLFKDPLSRKLKA